MASRLIHLPRTVACVGRNYMAHITEMANKKPTEPFFFLKPASSILQPGAGPVVIPRDAEVHHEVELGIVIGRDIDDVSAEEVRREEEEWAAGKRKPEGSIIGGYFVGVDMTARTYQNKEKHLGLSWTFGKCLKTFLPVSGFIPRAALPPFPDSSKAEVELHLEVNGVTKQQESTSLMLNDIASLIGVISSAFPLYKGDVVLTGTPKGVGEVKGGDILTAGIRVKGKEVEEGRIQVPVEWRTGGYGSPQRQSRL